MRKVYAKMSPELIPLGLSRKQEASQRTTATWLVVLQLFVFWLLTVLPAAAQVRPAASPIVSKRIQNITELIPGSETDFPAYLAKPGDIYLLVTAGASYTEIEVLADPEVSPASVAQALSSALTGTSLQGRTVTWSADRDLVGRP